MNLIYKTITSKDALIPYQEDILDLFKSSFKKNLSSEQWRWAYIQCIGNPVVTLCFDDDRLIGHYAIIPMPLSRGDRQVLCGLSMTTMVESSFRRYSVFVEMANRTYDQATKDGYAYVYGFPNKNSLPGFKKRLEWRIQEDVYLAYMPLAQILDHLKLAGSGLADELKFDLTNEALLSWRLSKPEVDYVSENKIIYKTYNDKKDLLLIREGSSGYRLDAEYYTLVSRDIGKFMTYKVSDYPIGYRKLQNDGESFDLMPELILSDVF